MPEENTVLTALGLDTSRFESGVGRAASSITVLSQALNSVDKELRSIPIIGDIYNATFGKIVDGFARTRTEGREFAQVMRTDVAGGLDESMAKLEQTTELIGKLKTSDLGRKFSDWATDGTRFAGTLGEIASKLTQVTTNAVTSSSAWQKASGFFDNFKTSASSAFSIVYKKSGLESIVSGTKAVIAPVVEATKAVTGYNQAVKAVSSALTGVKAVLPKSKGTVEDERAAKINKLEQERQKLLSSIVSLHQKEEASRSEAYSKSTLITENARIELELASKIAKSQEEATKFGGPDRDKWDKKIEQNLTQEISLARQVAAAEKDVAQMRAQQVRLANALTAAEAYNQVTGNSRTSANIQLQVAKQLFEISKKGTIQQQEEAAAGLKAAEARSVAAELDYKYASRQLAIETDLMTLQVEGQTRAANQAAIQAKYEVQIEEAIRSQNYELADSLKKQRQLSELAEQIREYNLGAGGRAAERLQERRDAQTVRIVQSQQRNRIEDQKDKSGLRSGGLNSGGLRSGGLGHVEHRDKPKPVDPNTQFKTDLMTTLRDIAKELGT